MQNHPGINDKVGQECLMAKAKSKRREDRIEMEIVVDAYGPEERAMGWYYYLDNVMKFPFTATCNAERATSPLKKGDEVEILALADADDCEHEILVITRWDPLVQLKPASGTDRATVQAVEDWHYWVNQGYKY
jgi:hypothetical protein